MTGVFQKMAKRKHWRMTVESWNGKFNLVVGKRKFKLYRDGVLILEDEYTEDKTPKAVIKEKVPPDIYKCGRWEIRYYAFMVDNEDFNRVEQEVKEMAKSVDKDLAVNLAISSYNEEPVVHIVGILNGEIVATVQLLRDFEEFLNYYKTLKQKGNV